MHEHGGGPGAGSDQLMTIAGIVRSMKRVCKKVIGRQCNPPPARRYSKQKGGLLIACTCIGVTTGSTLLKQLSTLG